MNKENIFKIINQTTKECEENFKNHQITGYTIGDKTVIPFMSETIKSRVVSSWGTDEDEDFYLWYSTDGWQKCWQTTQVGAGVSKIIEEVISKINQTDVVEIYQKMNTFQQLEFLSSCYKVLAISKYRYEIK